MCSVSPARPSGTPANRRLSRFAAAIAAAVLCTACSPREPDHEPSSSDSPPPAAEARAPVSPAVTGATRLTVRNVKRGGQQRRTAELLALDDVEQLAALVTALDAQPLCQVAHHCAADFELIFGASDGDVSAFLSHGRLLQWDGSDELRLIGDQGAALLSAVFARAGVPLDPYYLQGINDAEHCGAGLRLDAPIADVVDAAEGHVRAGRFEDARDAVIRLILATGGTSRLEYLLGKSYYDEKRFERARFHFERALEYEPTITTAFVSLGFCLNDLGDFEGAARVFERFLEWNPNHGGAHYGLALIAIEEARLVDAEAHLNHSIGGSIRNPRGEASSRIKLADVFIWRGDLDGAKRELELAASLDPDRYAARLKLARLLARMGERDAARAVMDAAEDVKDRDPRFGRDTRPDASEWEDE